MTSLSPPIIALQRGLPLVPRPFQALGASCDCSEAELVRQARQALAGGMARRLGAVFEAEALGYRSVLCAAAVAVEEAESRLSFLLEDPGVTHLYLRGWAPELPSTHPARLPEGVPAAWFTFSEHASRFDARLEAIRRRLAPAPLYVLPAQHRFKVQVVFGNAAGAGHGPSRPSGPPFLPTPLDQRLIGRLQGHVEPEPALWATLAAECGVEEALLLERLRIWKEAGALRRVALILRHREAGFTANAMCVWPAGEAEALAAGPRLASHAEVTHCYSRPSFPGFPYSLYAMTHARNWPALLELFGRLSAAAGLEGGRMLCSLRELKKSSLLFFPPPPASL